MTPFTPIMSPKPKLMSFRGKPFDRLRANGLIRQVADIPFVVSLSNHERNPFPALEECIVSQGWRHQGSTEGVIEFPRGKEF